MTKKNLDELLGSEDETPKQVNFNKSQFDDPKGQYLLKLQQSYNDDRFKITDRFKDDINLKKVSKKAQLDTETARFTPVQAKQSDEQNNLLKILGEIIPEEKRFIDNEIKHKKTNNFMIQRFDPSQLKTHKLVVKHEKKEVKKEKFVPKVDKGIDKHKLKVMQGEKKLKINKEKIVVKPKIKKINSQGWKEVLQEQENFSLFS